MCSLRDLIRTLPQFTVLKAAAFLISNVPVLNCAENGVFLHFHYILCPVLERGRGHGLLAYARGVLTFEMLAASLAPAHVPLPKTEEPSSPTDSCGLDSAFFGSCFPFGERDA